MKLKHLIFKWVVVEIITFINIFIVVSFNIFVNVKLTVQLKICDMQLGPYLYFANVKLYSCNLQNQTC